jgi:hypothetical protein
MDSCWASCLGNCSDKLSREHLISEGLFLEDLMTVEGFSWCAGKPVQVGLANLTAKILCVRHNNDLSDVDEAGAKAFGALREMRRVANVREKMKPARWTVFRDRVDAWARTLVPKDVNQSVLRNRSTDWEGLGY